MVWSSLTDGSAEHSIMMMDGSCFGSMEEILLGRVSEVI
jgi:hypothetical protein